ncbi:MAG: FAD/FMN-containing dehydrogenase [Promethearchaeota archaeon CR_4]|nr:MAG: FAD/FMN-containing dehydrogenase [Candidatus Lokiarchaeota archaeon CR_4]
MVLEPEVYAAFERVVGPENLSTKDAVIQVYAFNWGVELMNIQQGGDFSPFTIPPAAVILPATTSEVQQVVQLCNQYDLKFKAFSTGFGPWNTVSRPHTILIDLRRMNHIVEIDEKNLHVVIEPYVTGSQLQAELLKKGLNCHMPGAGPQVSALASSTSMAGPGFTSPVTGYSARNVLGVEWVLPSGDILRLGALGLQDPKHAGWYTGDGPGPSLRGIMRGFMGAMGGLGVFTRVAVKLYPFPCSASWQVSGNSPDFTFHVPDFMRYHVLDYKTYEAMEAGMRRIEEEEICFMCFHTSAYGLGAIFSHSIGTFIKQIPHYLFMKHPVVTMLTAHSKRELDYKEKVLTSLVAETGCKDLTALNKIVPKDTSYAEALRSLLGFHGFLIGTSFQSTHGGLETMTMCRNMIQANIPLKQTYIKQKVIGPDKGQGVWATSYEHGHFFHAEMPSMYDQTDEKSCRGMANYMTDCDEMDLTHRFSNPFFIVGDKLHDKFGPQCNNYHVWLRKIKEALDPKNISDPGFYISPQAGDR